MVPKETVHCRRSMKGAIAIRVIHQLKKLATITLAQQPAQTDFLYSGTPTDYPDADYPINAIYQTNIQLLEWALTT
jgi:hypothetical protein